MSNELIIQIIITIISFHTTKYVELWIEIISQLQKTLINSSHFLDIYSPIAFYSEYHRDK